MSQAVRLLWMVCLILYLNVTVLGKDGDIDDDGIADSNDTCAFGLPSSVDDDRDGIADNCDMYVAASDNTNVSVPVQLTASKHNTASSRIGLNSNSWQRAATSDGVNTFSTIADTKPAIDNALAQKTLPNNREETEAFPVVWWVVFVVVAITGGYVFGKRVKYMQR